jgi:hypothetical protein
MSVLFIFSSWWTPFKVVRRDSWTYREQKFRWLCGLVVVELGFKSKMALDFVVCYTEGGAYGYLTSLNGEIFDCDGRVYWKDG